MINNIKRFFEDNFSPSSLSGNANVVGDESTTQLALTALMIEIAESDFQDAPEERTAIHEIVKNSFNVSSKKAENIIRLAREEHQNSTDYFQFTRLINDTYSAQQKIDLIENLWKVAFSDQVIDKFEEHVIRRIADLIYVSHSDFMTTKLRVMGQ